MGSHYKIRAEKTGHFFMHGTPTAKTRFVWVCLPGYGQLAKNFIQKFEFLDPAVHWVIVPEGLNRFYYEGVHERPAASWMTREDRLDEIADYVGFLEALRNKLSWDKNENLQIIYLGFSQGVSTLVRWLTNIHPRVDHLILWAGSVPEDIPIELHQPFFQKFKTYYFIGRQDPFISEQLASDYEELMRRAGMNYTLNWFEGDHKIEQDVMQRWIDDHLSM